MSNLHKIYKIDVKSPDIDLYIFNRFKLNAVKEWGVELQTLKSHIKKANADSNSLIVVGGPVSQLPVGLLDITHGGETMKNIMEAISGDEGKMEEQLEEYNALNKAEQDEYFLNADDKFKFYLLAVNGQIKIDGFEIPKDGFKTSSQNQLAKYAKDLKKQLKEIYFDPYIDQMEEIFKESIDKDKIVALIPANEEFKAENVGYKNMFKEFGKRIGKEEIYLDKRFAYFDLKFNSFLTEMKDKHMSMYMSTSLYNGKNLKSIQTKLFSTMGEQHPNADFLVTAGYSELAVFAKQKDYYDPINNVMITKPQWYINIPGYQTVGDPNKVRLKSFRENTVNNYKLKIGMAKNPNFIKHPELLDEDGNIIDIFSEEYLSNAKDPNSIQNLDRKSLVTYEAPFIPYVHVIELGKHAATPSYSPLLKSMYPKNAAKSEELKAEIVTQKRLISDMPNIVRSMGGSNAEKIAAYLEEFDFSSIAEVSKVFREHEKIQEKTLSKTK